MPKNQIIVVLGVLIVLLAIFDGLPRAWENFLQILIGLSIVGVSVWSNIDKRLTLKAKAAQRRMAHKQRLLQAAQDQAVEPFTTSQENQQF